RAVWSCCTRQLSRRCRASRPAMPARFFATVAIRSIIYRLNRWDECSSQRDMKSRTAPNRAAGPDLPTLHLHQTLDNRQPQAAATGLAGASFVGAVEALEDLR